MMKKLALVALLLCPVLLAAQTTPPPTLLISDLTKAKLLWEHDDIGRSYFNTCSSATTCVTTAVGTIAVGEVPSAAGLKVYEAAFPTVTVGLRTVGVRACNGSGQCSAQGTLIVNVTDIIPMVPGTLRFKVVKLVEAPPPDPLGLGRFRLRPDSPYAGGGTDGKDMGPNIDAMIADLCGVVSGNPVGDGCPPKTYTLSTGPGGAVQAVEP
jgi:hypothetical protein